MDLQTIDSTSETYLGQWNRLVSTTNWEKGRIISKWRGELTAADAPVTEYSDEAWSRRVGNVTPQHVGRLRRVFDRFDVTRETYPGLYWSHFQAAVDWDDAELWLEGAIQNGWSISEMRRMRWESMGAPVEQQPRESDVISAELDEDAGVQADDERAPPFDVEVAEARDLHARAEHDAEPAAYDAVDPEAAQGTSERVVVQPFAALPSLPSDVTDAFESFKLCILRHRLAGWQEISLDDLLATLDALKELAAAPAE